MTYSLIRDSGRWDNTNRNPKYDLCVKILLP